MTATLTVPPPAVASWFGGAGSIAGNIDDASGANAVRDVRVYDSFSGLLIRKAASGTDGNYTVSDLKVGLVIDVVFLDDAAGTVYDHIIESRVTVA